MINFISNLSPGLRTGGFSAMNALAFDALTSKYAVNVVAPISPGINYLSKSVSKARRIFGKPGAYYFFSESRLSSISSEIEKKCSDNASLDFFHGFTPWIFVKPRRPYVASSDCTFKDYIDIYHNKSHFLDADISRIVQKEAEWLHGADAVVFSSQWAAERAKSDYLLHPSKVHVIPPIGELNGFGNDCYSGSLKFAFISTNFVAKGGPAIVTAFQELKRKYPSIELAVVGDMPPGARSGYGIDYTGYLRKEVKVERQVLVQIFSRARAIVNFTSTDTMPILFLEAASFGCPVVSANRFAIPEIVTNGVTGFLLDREGDLAEAMERLLVDESKYSLMRQAALKAASKLNSVHRFQEQLGSVVDGLL